MTLTRTLTMRFVQTFCLFACVIVIVADVSAVVVSFCNFLPCPVLFFCYCSVVVIIVVDIVVSHVSSSVLPLLFFLHLISIQSFFTSTLLSLPKPYTHSHRVLKRTRRSSRRCARRTEIDRERAPGPSAPPLATGPPRGW